MKFILTVLFLVSAFPGFAEKAELEPLLAKIEQARKPTITVPVKTCVSRVISFIPALEHPLYIDNIFKAPDKIRIVTRLQGGDTVVQAFNGRIAWERHGQAPLRILDGAAADYLRFLALLSGPGAQLKDCFEKIHLDPETVTVDRVPCYKLTGVPAAYFRQMPVIYYIAQTDFLPRRIDMGVFANGTLSLMTSWFGVYRNYNGIILPEETRTASPMSPVVSRVLSVTVNEEINDREFEPLP
jgi:hypothetical protein